MVWRHENDRLPVISFVVNSDVQSPDIWRSVHGLPAGQSADRGLASLVGQSRYGERVTALWSFAEQPRSGDPLLPGATPASIRDALLAEDKTTFDAACQRALTAAREDLDLTELFRCLEHWRRVALLQRDPDRFASIAPPRR